MSERTVTRAEVEDFLYHEARLLDEWKLDDWVALFTEDGEYLIPPTDVPDGDPQRDLFLVYDDRHRLGERAKRLAKKSAHAEFPHSRTRHMISNVEVRQAGAAVQARCNFVVYRSKQGVNDIYPGHSLYELRAGADGSLRIRSKRAVLDVDTLRPQGKVSIIL
ncbi:MAG: aromatic-ring-hydroxylating dioxygenase subunit beta [Burkholderiales bacterium]|nr:aromatic-ring-hydroxylating dioxygenase subunit beta [Burkholderiales bacterium]